LGKIVLILSAGKIADKFSFVKPLYDNPGLLPVNSKSCLRLIINFYLENREGIDNIYIATDNQGFEEINNEFSNNSFVHVLNVGFSNGVNTTLISAIKKLANFNECIINISTTIPNIVPQLNEVIVGDEKMLFSNYSGFIFNKSGIKFLYKNKISKYYQGYPFTGIFCVSNETLYSLLNEDLSLLEDDLLLIIKCLSTKCKLTYHKTKWYDIGHEINYFESRISYMVSRSFNRMKLFKNGILRKTSTDSKKLKNEIDYIIKLPKSLQIYYPRVFDFKNHKLGASVDIEFYGYPNLSEYQLYWKIDELTWRKIFNSIQNILLTFSKNKTLLNRDTYMSFMYGKVEQRIADFYQISSTTFSKAQHLNINYKKYKNWHIIKKDVLKRIELMYDKNAFCIMHGDLCFNNILFDRVGGNIKLIDSRGSYGEEVGVFGDLRYDLAKFLHSSFFHYDYLVNDLFVLNENDSNYNLEFKLRNNQSLLDKLSTELVSKFGYEQRDISFIVGLLFISMCPLHSDNLKRQEAMYLHGIMILNQNL
jgi:hypothetical protein